MNLGINKVVQDGNGNTLIYTALLAAAIANTLPTPFDAIYFRRINTLQRKYDDKQISAENLEWHVAGEYYLWTSLWYVTLFTGIYAFGGKYKNNAKILLALAAGGLVIGAVNKNISVNKEIEQKKSGTKSFTGSEDAIVNGVWGVKKSEGFDVFQDKSFTGDEENFWNNAFEDTKSNLVVKGFPDSN
jgi:hypothetical protein